jgi:hypothetical protein
MNVNALKGLVESGSVRRVQGKGVKSFAKR